MRTQTIRYLLAAALAAWPGLLPAQPTAHYEPGIEGIKGPSLPPPGFYIRDYNVIYTADQLNDPSGHNLHVQNLNALIYANVPRAIWITPEKLLGGNLGVDALLPLVYTSLKVPPAHFDQSTFGVGDFFAEGTLSWHPKQFDFSVGAGSWAPTGDSAKGLTTRAGKGYWTPMFTAGATWYPDAAKTWAISALSRYEINTQDRDTHITTGDAYTLEWGISKSVIKTIDLGLVGYYQDQITADTHLPAGASSGYNSVAAVGPEINVAFPSCMLFASLRYNYEFMAENRLQGHTIALTLTKKF
jgi:hypothetical protein